MNRSRLARVAYLAISLATGFSVVACSNKVTAPTPTVKSLTVSSATDVIKIGSTERFTATAFLSDGSSKDVGVTWSTDAPQIATVAFDGTVTGRADGQAPISATYQAPGSATNAIFGAGRRIRVVPD